MSGGVDSSVAAALLVEQGYDVVGATMKLFCHGEDVPDRPCCSLDSVNDARRVWEQLAIPHYVLNLETRFGHDVVDNFVAEYARGRTPIPCVRCNTFTKFRDFLKKADAIDARWIATGHYARVVDITTRAALRVVGEQEYPVPGLPAPRDILAMSELEKLNLPVAERGIGAEGISQYEAVRLFIARAVAVRPDFAVTNENAPAVAAICQDIVGRCSFIDVLEEAVDAALR